MKFFKEVIASLLKQSDDVFSGHSIFRLADPKAIGENPVREYKLDAVPLDEDKVMITLSQDGGEKAFEKTLSSSEANHIFSLISSDLAEAVSLTADQKYDEAKEAVKKVLEHYVGATDTPVETNLPPLHNTQAEKDIDEGLWKIAGEVKMQNVFPSGTVQNLTFSSPEDLQAYTEKQKSLQPSKPLWEQEGEKKVLETKDELSLPSMSYEDLEKEKEKETKNLDKRIKDQVKTELESSLEEKKATMFGEKDEKLIQGLKAVGRTWDEIKKFMVKELAYDSESVDLYIDDLRSKEEGIPHEQPKSEDVLRPPKELVPDFVHEKLLKDLEDKKEKPMEEVKEVEKVEEPPIMEESAKSTVCPECDGEGSVPAVRGGRVVALDCPNCGGDTHITQAPKELESSQEEIARADNSEIRKVAEEKCHCGHLRSHHEEGELASDNGCDDCDCPAFSNKEASFIKAKVASYMNISEEDVIEKQAANDLNPLQEPIEEKPTLPTQDVVPMEKPIDHQKPQNGDRVFVSSDLIGEKAGFEATFVSEYKSKGTDFSIVETDDGDLLDIESHRVVKTSEGAGAQVAEPVMEPIIEKPQEEIPVIPSTEKLTSLTSELKEKAAVKCEVCEDLLSEKDPSREYDSTCVGYLCPKHEEEYNKKKKESSQDDLLTIKAEAEALLNKIAEIGEDESFGELWPALGGTFVKHEDHEDAKVGTDTATGSTMWECPRNSGKMRWDIKTKTAQFCFPKDGLKKEARQTDSAFEGDGWVRVWIDQDDIDIQPEYKEVLKLQDENARIAALKEIARNLAYSQLEDAKEQASVYASFNFDSLVSSEYDRIDWVALANPQQEEIESSLKTEAAKSTKCVKCDKELPVADMVENVHGAGYLCEEHAKEWNQDKKASDFEKGISQNKTADEPTVEPKIQYKELKKAPSGVDREKAVPASSELDIVLAKMDTLQQNLSTLDDAKKQILAKMQEDISKLEQSAERVQMEKELQESINKAGVLIDALENKVVAWRDKVYTMQNQEVSYVPNVTPKEMLEKIYSKFFGAQQFVESVLNGMKSQAVNVLEKTLVKFPAKKSSLSKEASVIDTWNEELLEALKLLSVEL